MTTSQMDPGGKQWLGRMWVCCVGMGLTVVGGFFCWWLWAAWEKARQMDAWVEVEAEIIRSEVGIYRYSEISQTEYYPAVRYRFAWEGESHESERIRRVPVRSAHRDKAERWVERYPLGEKVVAFVDPAESGRAVLRKDTKAALYAIWFPALFVAGGLGMGINAMRGGAAGKAKRASSVRASS